MPARPTSIAFALDERKRLGGDPRFAVLPGGGWRPGAARGGRVQFAWPLARYLPLVPSYGSGTVELWVVWPWSYPAVIWIRLGLLYLERLRRTRP